MTQKESNQNSLGNTLHSLPSNENQLLTSQEAAGYIGVAENTLTVWRCNGRYGIEFVKVGRLVRYRKSALDAFLDRRTVGGEK
jgi:excisionase family DNA binding protein